MYSIGEQVIYSSFGVYKIIDIRNERVLGEVRTYYVLSEPSDSQSSLVYVPVGSATEKSTIRPLISRDAAESIISSYGDIEPAAWDDNSRNRAVMHKKILDSGDRMALAGLIKLIDIKQSERVTSGKKPFLTDEHTRERAVKLLVSELSTVLNLSYEEVYTRLFG